MSCPLGILDQPQLFIDKLLVYEAKGVCFTQHAGAKHPANPLVKADQPWEGWRIGLYGTVLFDEEEQIFKMWYLAGGDRELGFFEKQGVTCYAVSADGLRWEKPLIGVLVSRNGKPHNAVAEVELASVIKDVNEPDPLKRYKMIGYDRGIGYHTYTSPDGLRWTKFSKHPIAPLYDVITGFWDPGRRRYVAFPKNHAVPWMGHVRRLFYTITSDDFINWSEPVLSWTTDLRDDAGSLARIERVRPLLDRPDDPKLMRTEYYGVGAYPTESCVIGFPWMLTVNNNARFLDQGKYVNHEGPLEVQLAVSRDLVNWERPFRAPVIPKGKIGEWDCGAQTTASAAIRVGDEILLYYGGGNCTHGTPALYRAEFEDGTSTGRKTKYTGSIGLVKWKLDRFVSVDGPSSGGELLTVPVCFSGQRLEINALTKKGGWITVELCDAAGKRLESVPPSVPFEGDDFRHTVVFGTRADVAAFAGRPVCLRFHLADAELFSFGFRQ